MIHRMLYRKKKKEKLEDFVGIFAHIKERKVFVTHDLYQEPFRRLWSKSGLDKRMGPGSGHEGVQ